MTINMASVEVGDGSEKLQGHLMAPDFFDIENFATAEFTFDSHEEGIVYGSVNVVGKEMAVEAETTVDGNTLNVSDFTIDMSELGFFTTEAAEKPEEERHDANIGISATIVGME
jgi:polyisoprenoid-binding protein YceI